MCKITLPRLFQSVGMWSTEREAALPSARCVVHSVDGDVK